MTIRIFPLLLTPALLLCSSHLFAQNEGEEGYENYYSTPDSTATDSTGDDYYYEDYDPYAEEGEEKKKPEKKPYVRIEMPYDTISELITYMGVIEQEESLYDSLYTRAMRYMIRKFKLEEKAFKEGMIDQNKISMTVKMPLKVKMNKYVTEEKGELEFKLTLWFKDGKYKYEITNMKHIMPEGAAGKKGKGLEYVYLEYYMKSEKNIIGNDLLLRAADANVNTVLAEVRKALREPRVKEEDEFDF